MNRYISLNFFAVVCGFVAIEFVVLPYTLLFIYPYLGNVNDLAALLLLSFPRMIFIFSFVLLVGKHYSSLLRLAIGFVYFTILCVRFLMSEKYIQSNNFYAIANALTPYFLGFFTFIVASIVTRFEKTKSQFARHPLQKEIN